MADLHENGEVFGSPGRLLRGVYHAPVCSCGQGVVLCYPFGEERKCCARTMALAARRFCAHGYHVLRFDYFGTGESDGHLEEATVRQWLDDIHTAREHLAELAGTTAIGLLGIRFGATLAAMYDHTPLSCLVLWAPLADGHECLTECQRRLATAYLVAGQRPDSNIKALNEGKGIDLGGFCLPRSLRQEIEGARLPTTYSARVGRVLLADFTGRNSLSSWHKSLTASRQNAPPEVRFLSLTVRPFWMTAGRYDPNDLVDRTIDALRTGQSVTSSCGELHT
jgi:uncharacterized protein